MLFTIAVLATLANSPIPSPSADSVQGYTQARVDSLYAILDSAAKIIEKRYRRTGTLRTYDTRETGGVRFTKFEEDIKAILPASFLVRSTWRVTVGTFTRDTTQTRMITDEEVTAPLEKWFKIALLNPANPTHLPIVSLSVRLENGRPSRVRFHEFIDEHLRLQLSTETDTVGQEVLSDTTLSPGD